METMYNLNHLVSIEYRKLREAEYYIAEPVDSFFPWMRRPKRICSSESYGDWWTTFENFANEFKEILLID